MTRGTFEWLMRQDGNVLEAGLYSSCGHRFYLNQRQKGTVMMPIISDSSLEFINCLFVFRESLDLRVLLDVILNIFQPLQCLQSGASRSGSGTVRLSFYTFHLTSFSGMTPLITTLPRALISLTAAAESPF